MRFNMRNLRRKRYFQQHKHCLRILRDHQAPGGSNIELEPVKQELYWLLASRQDLAWRKLIAINPIEINF